MKRHYETRTVGLIPALACSLVIFAAVSSEGGVSGNLLRNASFEEGMNKRGVPNGWSLYAGGGKELAIRLSPTAESGGKAVLIQDGDTVREIGITQTVPGKPGVTYEFSAMGRAVPGASSGGIYLQLRFLPSNKYFQTGLAASSTAKFEAASVKGTAPADTRRVIVYVYTHAGPTPTVIVDSVRLVSGVPPPPQPLAPGPPAVPPVYTKLKDLCLTTDLVKRGRPNATIIVPRSGIYAEQAARIRQAVKKLTRVTLPIATDDSPAGKVPITGDLIVLGNRSTNKTIGRLYDLYYTLLDLRYPGVGGSVVRTLHNPFGDGRNVLFVGGSDVAGVSAATEVLISKLDAAGRKRRSLSIGRLAEIALGKGPRLPQNVQDFEIWEASKGYGSVGYFGWNSISKRMAAYYMTGEEFHAREFIRLAFPDAKALREIAKIDGERIENKNIPLSGTYHYNSHMMILFWDLIEESPVFSDEERLRVTNAFSKQLDHRKGEGIYRLTRPPTAVGSRHGQWSAVSIYCLGRYFQKDYPNPIWRHCVESAKLHFASLHKHAWVSGENDNLFWYNTAIAPVLTHLVLTGDREPVENGVLGTLLQGQDILVSGRVPDSALNSASVGYLHKAAYLMQDGRFTLYRQRTGVDTNVFRLGQSFWPEEHLAPKPPDNLIGKWTVHALSEPMWRARRNGFELDESFQFASYRSSTDAFGDFLLIDGFNGASRNPYHTFAILELRLDGRALLKGYYNQVFTRADGLVEPKVAMNAALRYRDVVGPTAVAVAEVPNAPYCNWRRTLVQRTGRYVLVVDDLTFRADSNSMEAEIKWETPSMARCPASTHGVVRLSSTAPTRPSPGLLRTRALDCQCTTNLEDPGSIVRLHNLDITLLRSSKPGDWIEMPFRLDKDVTAEVFVELMNYRDRGVVRMFLDGKRAGKKYNHYAEGIVSEKVSLGKHKLEAGEHRLRVEVAALHEPGGKCYVGLTGVSVVAEGAASAPRAAPFFICISDPVKTTVRGRITSMQWFGDAKKGRHKIFFSVIAQNPGDPKVSPGCVRVAENAVAVSLPGAGLAVAGKYGEIEGELVVLAEDHLFGKGLRSAGFDGAFVTANAPVDLDWDFRTGRVDVVAAKKTLLNLRLASRARVRVDGKRVELAQEEIGMFLLHVKRGRHVVEGLKPHPAALRAMSPRLKALLAEGRKARAQLSASIATERAIKAPPLHVAFTSDVGGPVADLITIPAKRGRLICAAEGNHIHVLPTDGKARRTFQADGTVRMMRWWPEHNLLLAGCADEQVIAFDRSGRRKWVFTSVMDPAVFRAAKTYWFKSARSHKGIHGVYTGVFMNGKSQAFVGSACTLEILDERGKLVKRMPQFWGDESTFVLVDAPDGSVNLLAGRKISGTIHVKIVNSKTLATRRGFDSVPPGHSYVGGWCAMNRNHLFCEDLDGDGVKEVCSEINGTWNRVTVWTLAGKALYNAQFGPGAKMPAKNVRDMDIADLDGDGKKEIVIATSRGLVVTLDCQCRRRWARRLDSPPTVLKCVGRRRGKTPWIAVGCEDGTIVILNGDGAPVRLGKVRGRPTCIEALGADTPNPIVLFATRKGEVKGFAVAE